MAYSYKAASRGTGGRLLGGVQVRRRSGKEPTTATEDDKQRVAEDIGRAAATTGRETGSGNWGYGTLEELLEVITWSQLGIHDKPVGLLNVDGYYNALLSFIDKAVEEGFIKPTARHIIVLALTPKELLEKLEEYSPRHEKMAPKMKWEKEQLSYCKNCEIPGLHEGKVIIQAQRGSML